MIQGTMSNAGKSLIAAGLCRVFKQDGYKVAPFKAQNMALNSFITREGLEMGRAQVVQAEAAGVEPSVLMNPILLKPTTDMGSQIILNGEVWGQLSARDYFAQKKKLLPDVLKAYNTLSAQNDAIIIEGAGSPVEINLKDSDVYVNMDMAKAAKAPVLLVGDIDRGGVFAQLYGTVALFTEEERAMVKGVIINKFRGDQTILDPGIKMLEDLIHIPVVGVVPWVRLDIDDEDSLSERLTNREAALVDIAVIRLPRIANFTDFKALEGIDGVSVRYINSTRQFGEPDMVIIPGTKNTMADLLWMRQNGLEAKIQRFSDVGGPVLGICGGYQMLGRSLHDPLHTESRIPEMAGLGLLDMEVAFAKEKHTAQASGVVEASGWLTDANGVTVDGYEIHAGHNHLGENAVPWLRIGGKVDGVMNAQGNVLGSYLHGLFDDGQLFAAIAAHIRKEKGIVTENQAPVSFQEFREREFDRIADIVRASVDMDMIYKIVRGEV